MEEIKKTIKKAKKSESSVNRAKYLVAYMEYVNSSIENAISKHEGEYVVVGDMYCPICDLHGPVCKWKDHIRQNSHSNSARKIFQLAPHDWSRLGNY